VKLRLLFFASLREALGTSGETLALPPAIGSIGALRAHLAARGGNWARVAAGGNVRCALDQTMVDDAAKLRDGAEVAFFPPVTGG
jgi:molybdopterin synthase sulfur carrier subunit